MTGMDKPIYIIHRPRQPACPAMVLDTGNLMRAISPEVKPRAFDNLEQAKVMAECMSAHVAEMPGVPSEVDCIWLESFTILTFD